MDRDIDVGTETEKQSMNFNVSSKAWGHLRTNQIKIKFRKKHTVSDRWLSFNGQSAIRANTVIDN